MDSTAVTLSYEQLIATVSTIIPRTDWIYDNFGTSDMANSMAYNLPDVLGRLSLTKRDGKDLVEAMLARVSENFHQGKRFDWDGVRYILGDYWNNGALEIFIAIIYSEEEDAIMNEMFARLIVCFLFCE
jgi:hypothetical protein